MVVDFEPRAAPGTLVFYSMAIQVAGVMLLMTCWQRQLAFEKFFHYYRHARDIESEDLWIERAASIKRNSRRFWIVQSYVLGSAVMFAGMTFMGRTKDLVHKRFSAVFYYPQLVYARPMMMIFYCTILNVALHTYICLTNAIYWEARKFNRKLISLRAFDRMDMRVKLETLIRHHSTIHRAVRELDSIYQIYAFFVIAITIPATLFVMLMIFSRQNALEIILSLPALAFCLYEYYGIMYPARLHEELNRSKATLCMNHHVWVPYEKGVNKLAQTLVMHVEQANLGISLWGFAIVTKPLILTTVSVLMTCLAFLMELRPRPGQSIMGRNNFTMSVANLHPETLALAATPGKRRDTS
ncbi:unnamed protein product, partial [Mesorhabditis spiculigera]